ncbi:MAG: hypothetical protein ACLPSH_03065 [Vulcanimicrobiaceae bacterium]
MTFVTGGVVLLLLEHPTAAKIKAKAAAAGKADAMLRLAADPASRRSLILFFFLMVCVKAHCAG